MIRQACKRSTCLHGCLMFPAFLCLHGESRSLQSSFSERKSERKGKRKWKGGQEVEGGQKKQKKSSYTKRQRKRWAQGEKRKRRCTQTHREKDSNKHAHKQMNTRKKTRNASDSRNKRKANTYTHPWTACRHKGIQEERRKEEKVIDSKKEEIRPETKTSERKKPLDRDRRCK